MAALIAGGAADRKGGADHQGGKLLEEQRATGSHRKAQDRRGASGAAVPPAQPDGHQDGPGSQGGENIFLANTGECDILKLKKGGAEVLEHFHATLYPAFSHKARQTLPTGDYKGERCENQGQKAEKSGFLFFVIRLDRKAQEGRKEEKRPQEAARMAQRLPGAVRCCYSSSMAAQPPGASMAAQIAGGAADRKGGADHQGGKLLENV